MAATLGDAEAPPDLCESFNVCRFDDPDIRARIETIPTTVTPDRPAKYEPVFSGDWIKAKSMSMLEDQDS